MKITFKNPVTNETHEITVAMSVPCAPVEIAIENILKNVPAEIQADVGHAVVSMVNKAMKNNAIADVLAADDVFAALFARKTYGKYTITPGESGTGYKLGSTNIVAKRVKVFNPNTKAVEEVSRPAFVTYADVVKYVKVLNNAAKKADETAEKIIINGDFNADEMRKLRYFVLAANGRLTENDIECLKKRGAEYSAFLEDRNSNSAKKARVQVFYDVFNKHTGKTVNAIHHVENNVVKECGSYNSMYKLDKDGGESAYISALFNEYMNSELLTATRYKAAKPEEEKAVKSGNKKGVVTKNPDGGLLAVPENNPEIG